MRVSPARQIAIVFAKEMRDHLRDRRSLLLSLVYPILGPLLLAALLLTGAGSLRSDGASPRVAVPTQVDRRSPAVDALADALGTRRFDVAIVSHDVEQLVRRGSEPIGIVVRHGSARAQIDVIIVFDPGNVMGGALAGRLASALNDHARERSQSSLKAAGVDLAIAEPIRVHGHPIAAQRDIAGLFYGMIPALLMFMVFLGGTHLAIDATAGERERGSLEPLLTAPVDRSALLTGKAGAALSFTALTVAIHLLGFKLILGLATASTEGFQAPPSWMIFGALFAVAVPVMLLAVALQFLIATITRSMKEAQIYLGLLPVVPALPGMALAFMSSASLTGLGHWPLAGQLVSFAQLVGGTSPDPAAAISAGGGTIAFALIAFWCAIRRFERTQQLSPG
ncbi:MAG: ABC transporter permease [Alphaproteobacteria bacterium]|nr:ABC transporter permease [Alphaproteobacteria bacterium]